MDERWKVDGIVRFGELELDVAAETLSRSGRLIPLQPQPMKVLILLATRPRQLVARRELREALWGDDTVVDFDQGINWCIRRIREVLGDDASSPRFIETVPRKGYRFIAAIDSERAPARPRLGAAAAALLLLLLLTSSTRSDRSVTVLVLPFDNFTGDPRNELAASVATEEVINRVGSIDPARIKVIDRYTAAKFKRTNDCILQMGRALRADFVMEGSLQQRRATAALYRVADNTQVWATAIEPRVETAPAAIAAKIASTFVSGRR